MATMFENSRLHHYAGISEDDSVGPDGSYLYGENIEQKRFFKHIELAKSAINLIDDTGLGGSAMLLGASTPTLTGGNIIFFLGNDGKIFNENGTLSYTDSKGLDLEYHSFSIADTYYYTSNSGSSGSPLRLNSITHEDIGSTWSGVNEDILNGDTLELIERGNTDRHRVLVIGSIAYISSGSSIAKFNPRADIDGTTGIYIPKVEAQFDFFPADIVGMTYSGGNIKVFLKNGEIYIWDGVNEESPIEIITTGEKLENAITIGSRDYVIGGELGNLPKFFYVEGYVLNQINRKQYSNLLGIFKFDIITTGNVQNIASINDQIFLLDELLNNSRIASYGNKLSGIPAGYSIDLTKASNGNIITGSIDFIFVAEGKLFFGYSNGTGDKGVEYINLEQTKGPYTSEGFVTELLFDGGDIIEVKKEEKLYGKCEIFAGTSIEILQSVNGSAFVSCKVVDETTELENGLFTLSDQSFNKTNYREATYKILLKTTDNSVTPRWHGFKTLYSFT